MAAEPLLEVGLMFNLPSENLFFFFFHSPFIEYLIPSNDKNAVLFCPAFELLSIKIMKITFFFFFSLLLNFDPSKIKALSNDKNMFLFFSFLFVKSLL